MKNIKTVLLSILALSSTSLLAQQEFQFSNYSDNPYLYNPAAGGLTGFTQIDLGFRDQHVSSDGNPMTVYASGSTVLNFGKDKAERGVFNPDGKMLYAPPLNEVGQFKHVIGGKLINDGIGPFMKTGIMATYAVHLPITDKVSFGVGLGLGWNNFSINPNKVSVLDEDDAVLQGFGARWNQNNVDLQAGLTVYTKRFTFGFSGLQLLGNKLSFSDYHDESKLVSHWLFYSSYKAGLGPSIVLEPFVLMRAVKHTPFSVDLGAKLHYRYIWLGAQYRTSQSFVVSLGLNFLKNFYLSYAFEYSAKPTRVAVAGTHEVQVGIFFGKSRKNVLKENAEKTGSESTPDSNSGK